MKHTEQVEYAKSQSLRVADDRVSFEGSPHASKGSPIKKGVHGEFADKTLGWKNIPAKGGNTLSKRGASKGKHHVFGFNGKQSLSKHVDSFEFMKGAFTKGGKGKGKKSFHGYTQKGKGLNDSELEPVDGFPMHPMLEWTPALDRNNPNNNPTDYGFMDGPTPRSSDPYPAREDSWERYKYDDKLFEKHDEDYDPNNGYAAY